MQPMPGSPPAAAADEGSTGLGFLAGFFGGVLGLVLVLVLAKGSKTKKGAIIGIIVQVVTAFVLGFVLALGFFMVKEPTSPTRTHTTSVPALPATR